MTYRAARTITETSALTARDQGLIASDGDGPSPEALQTALRDAAQALGDSDIPFALIGGIAVAVRSGTPRATRDVDLAVVTGVSRQNATDAMTAAGFVHRGDFAHSVNFRHPNGEPVQVAFDEDFDGPIAAADPVNVDGVSVPVVRTDDLIAMKQRAAADPSRRRSKALRDRADVELLHGDVPDEDEGW